MTHRQGLITDKTVDTGTTVIARNCEVRSRTTQSRRKGWIAASLMRLTMTIGFAAVAFGLTGCMDDDFSDCFYGISLKVVVPTETGGTGNELNDAVFDNITLYVFGEDGILLAEIPTEIGRTEVLDYPNAGKLTIVGVANIGASEELTTMTPGVTTLAEARVRLTRAADPTHYAFPSDVFMGKIEADNNRNTKEVIELPIRRSVAGVYVYVRNLRNYLGKPSAISDEFHVVLGGQYNCGNFHCQPSHVTRSLTDPVLYKLTGTYGNSVQTNYPTQTNPTTKTDYYKVLASDDGMPVSVGVYHNGTLIKTPLVPDGIITTADGAPLKIKNNRLNVIVIDYGLDLTVTIKDVSWGSTIGIGMDF